MNVINGDRVSAGDQLPQVRPYLHDMLRIMGADVLAKVSGKPDSANLSFTRDRY